MVGSYIHRRIDQRMEEGWVDGGGCGDWGGKGTSGWVETWDDGSVSLVLSDFSRAPACQCPRAPLSPSQPFLWWWSFCTVACVFFARLPLCLPSWA